MRTAYTREIAEAAVRHTLDRDLLEAQVMAESAGRAEAFRFEEGFYEKYLAGKPEWKEWVPRRISSSYGLMQIMFSTARQHGFSGEPEMLFVPFINLEWGSKHLASLLEWAEGDIIRALCAYNGGKAGNVVAPFRNQAYADKVLRQKLLLT